jgi:ADP-ribosyl-[dinitrogen reductase] hydrolase
VPEQGLLPEVRQRARAAFLGLALGDALGATVEFLTPGEIRAAHGVHRDIVGGGWLRLRAGAVTDDTEMSLAVARAIDRAGGWSLRGVADALAAWLKGRPTDVGSTCRAGIRRYLVQGTLHGPPNEWDAGNGAAMRMLPVALLTLGDRAALARLAIEQGHITHHHPLSDTSCILVGQLVQLACLGHPLGSLRAAAAEVVAAEPRLGWEPWRGNSTGYVADTIQTVLHFLLATGSFEDCLVAVVNQGGDADTTGAIGGAVAGALYGPAGLPRRWVRRLAPALRSELGLLADRLVDLSPLGRGSGAPAPLQR